MHSPWGLLYQIVKETGWTWYEVLWKVSRANILLMMADRPNFKQIDEDKAVKQDSGANLFNRFKAKKTP